MEERPALSEAERRLALARFQHLRPHLEEGVPLAEVARTRGHPLRTLQRWLAGYRGHGLAGLARRRRSDRGQRRLSEPLVRLVEGLALQKPILTIRTVQRRVGEAARERGEAPPSYWQTRQIVRGLPAALTTLAHEGRKAYSERFDLVYRREAATPNAVWQADHTLLDVLLVREGKAPAKPWLTTIIDDYSRAVAGYLLSFEAPSALHTALALRQAIWRKESPLWTVCGIPEILYTDNGSDFTSLHLEQVAADLKIRLILSTPGVPRGRGRIERFFDTVNQMLLGLLPGYAPAGGAVQGEPSLSLSDLDQRFQEFLLGTYHQRPETPPQERWEADGWLPQERWEADGWLPQERWEADGWLPQMPESLEQLDLLLLTVAKSRRVRPDGLRFQGLRYMDTTLAAYVGEDVILRYDPRDMAEVRVFYRDRFLCRAVCQEIAGETVALREIIQARKQRRRELGQTLSDRRQIVETLLAVHRPQSDPQPVPDPADSPAPTDSPVPKLKRYLNE